MSPSSPQRELAEGWAAYFHAACALSLVDAMLVVTRGGGAGASLHLLALSVALAAWVALPGALVVALALLVARLATPRLAGVPWWARAGVAGTAGGVLAAGVALFLLRSFDLLVDPYHLATLVPGTCVAAGAMIGLLWMRLPATATAGLLGAGALTAFAGDALVMRGLYRPLHDLAAFLALQAAMLAVWRVRRTLATPRCLGASALLALVAHLALLPDARGVRLVAQRHGTLEEQWLAAVRGFADIDRDGYSPLFWGGDCDDFNAAIRPGRCEIPGNTVDENCNGLTGASPPVAAVFPRRPPPAEQPDIYIIIVDALRFDLAGLGARAEVTPSLERLARSGLDFHLAYTSYPSTFRAITTLVQGRYWRYATGVAPNLFDRLDAAGWDVQLWIRFDRLHHTRAQRVLGMGPHGEENPFFVRKRDKTEWTDRIISDAIAEAGTPGPPRFRWLHLLDTHIPQLRGDPGASDIDHYRAEIRFVDGELTRFLDALDASERGRRAVVILLGDHGEAFGEHGSHFHGADLFEETAHVPVLMRLPGVTPRVIDQPSTHIDIVPTLAEYLGWPVDDSWQGHDWLAPGDGPSTRVLGQIDGVGDTLGGAGLPAMQLVHDGHYKLIVDIDDNLLSLYDLDSDPGERHDLVAAHPDVVARLYRVWAEWLDQPGCRD